MFNDFDSNDFESSNTVPDIPFLLKGHRQTIATKLVLLNDRKQKLGQVQQKLDQLQHQQKLLVQCSQILQDFYTNIQSASVRRLETFVTYCLREVFGDDAYEFRIKYETRRNQPEADFIFVRKDELGVEQIYSPTLSAGGGALDVCVFALRLAVVTSSTQKPRHLFILDEPFRYVSQNYRPNLVQLIETLATDYKFQFVIITHAEDLKSLGESGIGTLVQL